MDSQTLQITEDEAALYDRQIRLWGLEAQQRMRNSSILISGIRGLSNEVCKNLVLAGVGSVTIIDHNIVTEEDLGAQFLITEQDLGKNRALASANGVRHLNPRVVVKTDTDDIREKAEEFFENYDLICLTDSGPDTMIHVDRICRKYNKKFYSACTYGFFGYIFSDLNHHDYIQEKKTVVPGKEEPEITRLKKNEEFVSLETALSKNDWDQISVKKLNKISRVLWSVLNSLFTSNNINVSTVTDEFLRTFTLSITAELSPVCAILGGILAQDILNTLSQRELPINNFFLYDGSGVIYQVEPGKKIP
ncbi:putative sumo-1-activating enzyme E1a [Rhizophagus irregularis]|uniref:Ubiquitin-like 1-activating enzyme E1A n=1 Tax=Rhizophagus irregularis TaxID=588596 RepID=A0A2N0Q8S7_9GLOM|nr:putative sumo-1-activating enzyme E1a [Rhizophagus irregularis]